HRGPLRPGRPPAGPAVPPRPSHCRPIPEVLSGPVASMRFLAVNPPGTSRAPPARRGPKPRHERRPEMDGNGPAEGLRKSIKVHLYSGARGVEFVRSLKSSE